MKKMLLTFSLLFAMHCMAQQTPTLFDQLVYVNKEWLNQADADETLKHSPARQMSEVELVQFHLQETEKLLRKRNVPAMGAVLQKQRLINLDILNRYRNAGIFPLNDQHEARQPYFIDKVNTYCAVGYLMQKTGGDETAKEIKVQQNYSYLFDINHPKLLEWAATSGLSLTELALIQPTYANDRAATIIEIHYNNTGADVNEYIEFQQPNGIFSIQVANVLFYDNTNTLYKTLAVSSMTDVGGPGVKSYIFPSGESFADAGKVELRGAGDQLLEVFNYSATSISIITYSLGTINRNYSFGESEATPVGESLTFCGNSTGYSLNTTVTLQSLPATNGTINPCLTLPVSLKDFSYTIKEKGIQLLWETVTETNSSVFVIEKSKNGIEFTEAGSVAASGNSNSLKQYVWLDNNPSYVNHYRLKMVDKDGKSTYSKIVFVRFSNAIPMKVLENPVKNKVKLQINIDQSAIKSVVLYDVYAKRIKTVNAAEGIQSINVTGLLAGTYFIQMATKDGSIYYQQFVKL